MWGPGRAVRGRLVEQWHGPGGRGALPILPAPGSAAGDSQGATRTPLSPRRGHLMAARRATPPPPGLPPRNRLAIDYVAHCRTTHRAHLPGVAECAICLAARYVLAGGARRRGIPDLRVAGLALARAAVVLPQEALRLGQDKL